MAWLPAMAPGAARDLNAKMTPVSFERSRQRDAPVSHTVAPETVATTKRELVLADTMSQLQSGKRDCSIGE